MTEQDGLALLLSPMTAQSLVDVAPRPVARSMEDLFRVSQAYVKIKSMGQVGWLPRMNLAAAMVVDPELKVVG